MSELTFETIEFENKGGEVLHGLERPPQGTRQQLLDHIDFLKEEKEAIPRPHDQVHIIQMDDEDFVLRDSFCTEMGTLLADRLGDEGTTPEGYVKVLNQLVVDCIIRWDSMTSEPMPTGVRMAPQARYDYFSSYEGPMFANAFGNDFARRVQTIQETPPQEPLIVEELAGV